LALQHQELARIARFAQRAVSSARSTGPFSGFSIYQKLRLLSRHRALFAALPVMMIAGTS